MLMKLEGPPTRGLRGPNKLQFARPHMHVGDPSIAADEEVVLGSRD